ncbi:MAG: MATE family efflux transporter [Alistipes sp.]|nr:MATE family efflux transporter [Alistipes sp.]
MRLREYVPYYKRLLHLAAPVVLAQAGQLTTQFADTAMVGNYGGEDAVPLAAVSLGSSLFLLIYLAAMGFAMSITPLVGEHYARNDRRMVGHLFQNGIAYSLIIGVISTIIALALRPFIGVLGVWMSSSGDDVTAVTDMALPYYDMLVWSIMPLMIFLAVKQFLEGIGNTKVAMWITLVGNFLNIVLNWVFIFGKCGFEAMGAEGAGLATLIARVVQMLLIIAHFFLSRRLRIYRSFFSSEALSRKLMRRCVAIGFPISFQMVLESAAFILTSILALSFGAAASGAMQVSFSIANIAWMITVAIGSASTIVVSHIYGSKDRKHLRPMVTATYHLGLLWATLMAFMFVLLRTELVGIFTDNVEVMAISANLLILIAIYQFSDSVQGLSISMLRGLQDVKIIMPIVLCSYLILNIPLGALLAYQFDLQCYGLAIGLIVGLSSAAVMTFVRVRRDVRKFEQGRSKK